MPEVKGSNITVATFTPLADNVSAGDLMGATTDAPICISLPPQCDQTSTSPDGSIHSPSHDSKSPRQDTPRSRIDWYQLMLQEECECVYSVLRSCMASIVRKEQNTQLQCQ